MVLNGNGSTCVGLQSVIRTCPPPIPEVIIVDVADSNGDGENRTLLPPPPDVDEANPESDLTFPLPPATPETNTSSEIESGGVGLVGVPPLLVPP